MAGLTVVTGGQRAVGGEVVASSGEGAKSSAGVIGQTVSARVIGRATAENEDALTFGGAPLESIVTNTFAGGAVVVVGAIGGDVVASFGRSAPGGSGVEG